MDWMLSITTLLANSSLGWFRGDYRIWLIHATNAGAWILYSIYTQQYGLILLSVGTILVDVFSAYGDYRKEKK